MVYKKSILGEYSKYFENHYLREYVLYIIGTLLIMKLTYNIIYPPREGFVVNNEIIIKRGYSVYDKFYAKYYDMILYNEDRTNFEIDVINENTDLNEKSIVLDVGSGTGHHVKNLFDNNIKAIGIDISPSMVDKANDNFPDQDFRIIDATNKSGFENETFTHISCFNFTIYYMKDKDIFFSNCYKWLKPGGYVIINLVNKDNFDPIIENSNPFSISTTKYVTKCNNKTKIKLVDYDYKSNFEIYPNDTTATFHEQFTDPKTNAVRKNETILFMPSKKEIINILKNLGFILLSTMDMSNCNSDSQYIYIFQKPT